MTFKDGAYQLVAYSGTTENSSSSSNTAGFSDNMTTVIDDVVSDSEYSIASEASFFDPVTQTKHPYRGRSKRKKTKNQMIYRNSFLCYDENSNLPLDDDDKNTTIR